VVEWADVTSRDPYLLVELKAYRNTVPVPRHWNAKRKYLAGKRGFERPPFELPDFIKRTGIQEMRETMWEKEESQSLKSKMRERTRPKLGRIDIDYQKLHDAFFKWQTKPQCTKMGELYYEGKELEAQMREKKPGQLSDELRIALGMPVGPVGHGIISTVQYFTVNELRFPEREQIPTALADRHATLWAAAVLSKSENSGPQLPDSRGMRFWIPRLSQSPIDIAI
jgi:hypothetical protein